MCGITGFLTPHFDEISIRSLQRMTGALQHRGPDDSGIWLDHEHGVGLGHRRLAILDLSPAGKQPMHSCSGRYVLVLNGEVYNHLLLRKQLEAEGAQQKAWQGHSDTETLLACFEAWGLKKSLQNFVGMFAFALWDRQEGQLTLVRDRIGEKPLYYGWSNGSFLFASELKALRRYVVFTNPVARDVLPLYLRFSSLPAPYSIYQGIYKLEPGCMLTIDVSESYTEPDFVPHAPGEDAHWTLQRYWSLHEQIHRRGSEVLEIRDEQEALFALENALMQSVRSQSVADVSLGAFLSGGIDSSLVVALMQAQATGPVKTFTVGFAENSYSEADYAKAVAEHLGTDHTELYLTASQALEVIPHLPILYDEPFADSSQIPAFLLAQTARQYVTVALSGDGGDELFGGYNRYLWAPKIWRTIARLPCPLRQQLSHLLIRASKYTLPTRQQGMVQGLPIALAGEKLQKLGQRLQDVRDIDDFYLSLVSQWRTPEEVILSAQESTVPDSLVTDRKKWPQLERAEERMMYLDTMTYLPDDILCKVDRAAMGVGLETRAPFLDHRVVELAWKLPVRMKIRDGQGKWMLRRILYKYVPRELIERPKQGFAVPLGEWLRGPLRDWAEHLLEPVRLANEGYFQPEIIQQKWQEHISGKYNQEHSLWSVLMFQAWLETQQEQS